MDTTDSVPSNPKSLHERILVAAERLFDTKGYSNANLEEIAREAGTSASGIVRVFTNKHGVLAALYNRAWAAVNRRIEVALSSCPDDPREKLMNIARSVWQAYESSRRSVYPIILNTGIADMLILSSPTQRSDDLENLKYISLVRALCLECVEGGWVDESYSPRALSEGVFGIIEGMLVGWYQEDWAASSDTVADRVSIEEGMTLMKMMLYAVLKE